MEPSKFGSVQRRKIQKLILWPSRQSERKSQRAKIFKEYLRPSYGTVEIPGLLQEEAENIEIDFTTVSSIAEEKSQRPNV